MIISFCFQFLVLKYNFLQVNALILFIKSNIGLYQKFVYASRLYFRNSRIFCKIADLHGSSCKLSYFRNKKPIFNRFILQPKLKYMLKFNVILGLKNTTQIQPNIEIQLITNATSVCLILKMYLFVTSSIQFLRRLQFQAVRSPPSISFPRPTLFSQVCRLCVQNASMHAFVPIHFFHFYPIFVFLKTVE